MDFITVVSHRNDKTVENKGVSNTVETNTVRKNNFSSPIIEDWNSDDESEVDYIQAVKDKTVRPSTEKIKFVKTSREIVEKVETPKQNKHHPRGNQRNWNNLMSQRLGSGFKMINKACYVCGSFKHLHYVCDKKVIRPVWNNSSRVNHKNFANKLTHPHPKRGFVPQAVLTRSSKINTASASVNTAVRPVNTADSKPIVNSSRPTSNAFKRENSHVTRSVNGNSTNKNSIFNKKVNIVRVNDGIVKHKAVLSENKGNAVKDPTCWVWKAKNSSASTTFKKYSYIDARGKFKDMTGNKGYLTEFEDYDGGFVSFGDGKGRISGKGKIQTESLVFDDVYFYFKLLDESQVLLRVPRKDNIYSVNLKSIVPSGCLTCLFAKATIDESNIWHRRLGHINFKIMNKVVKENLVKGLPSKIFENDHSCGANKGYLTEFEDYDGGFVSFGDAKGRISGKGIKREFSVARTPQQNGVAERKNRTLIEAARTMLVDSKLPTTFRLKQLTLLAMDHLGKFDGKADEAYIVGYSVTRNGPDWLFDVDSLTISMNYVPVVAGNQTNGIAGTKDNIVAGQAQKEKEPEQEYIIIPLYTTDPLISQGPKDSEENARMKPS
ncbi:ribonuclease H-like domain-containing protein [Tanacetum coccineum]